MEGILPIQLPRYMENLQLPDPDLLMLYQNYEKRIIWLDSEVDVNWLEYAKKIVQWNAEDKGKDAQDRVPIKLFFFSPGGDLDINNLFLDVIRLSKTKVIGINTGIALSAGAFIYLACHERLTLPKATFLLHSGSAENISGTAEQIQSYNAQYKKQVKQLKEWLIECGLPKKTVDNKMRGEWFFDSEEAIKLGVAHKIIESLDEVV